MNVCVLYREQTSLGGNAFLSGSVLVDCVVRLTLQRSHV